MNTLTTSPLRWLDTTNIREWAAEWITTSGVARLTLHRDGGNLMFAWTIRGSGHWVRIKVADQDLYTLGCAVTTPEGWRRVVDRFVWGLEP